MEIKFTNEDGATITMHVNSVQLLFEDNQYLVTDSQLKMLKLTKIKGNPEGGYKTSNIAIEPNASNSFLFV